MRFLVAVQGSYGDINPCAGLSMGLRERGHEIVLLTSGYYQEYLQGLGLEAVSTVSREDHLRITSHPDFTHPVRAYRLLWELVTRAGRTEYQAIQERYEPGRTVVLARPLNTGPRLANQELGVRVQYLAVSPFEMGSLAPPDALKGILPAGIWRKLAAYVNRRLDRRIAGALNQLRKHLELPPAETWTAAADYRPPSILALFPEWYARPQPDWAPAQYAGFPQFDGGTNPQLIERVEKFLTEGDPPIVISAFSVAQTALEYFRSAVIAVQKIGVRALLLSSFPGNVPPGLPASIGYFGYIPLEWLLPRSVAIMHQGGIGTVAAALRAGIPQLVVPLNFDNGTNGGRVRDLGVGSVLRTRRFQPQRIAKEMENLLKSERIKERCSDYAERLRTVDAIDSACRIIENQCRQFGRNGPTSSESRAHSAPGAC